MRANKRVKHLRLMSRDFIKKYQINRFGELTETDPPVLPHKQRTPQRLEVGSAEGSHSATEEDRYRRQYYEVLDIAILSITGHFDQPCYQMYRNLECLPCQC